MKDSSSRRALPGAIVNYYAKRAFFECREFLEGLECLFGKRDLKRLRKA
jgi:hypothetical protein